MESLEALEQKVVRTLDALKEARDERDRYREQASEFDSLKARFQEVNQELEALRNERETVRKRLEKLLEHIDGASK